MRQLAARLVEPAEAEVGHGQGVVELVVIRLAIDLALGTSRAPSRSRWPAAPPRPGCRRRTAGTARPPPAASRSRRPPLSRPSRRSACASLASMRGLSGDALQRGVQHGFGARGVAVAQVDHGQRVVRAEELRIEAHRLAGAPVRVVDLAGHQRLGGAVVHVHRQHRVLLDRMHVQAEGVGRRHEVDRCRADSGRLCRRCRRTGAPAAGSRGRS